MWWKKLKNPETFQGPLRPPSGKFHDSRANAKEFEDGLDDSPDGFEEMEMGEETFLDPPLSENRDYD